MAVLPSIPELAVLSTSWLLTYLAHSTVILAGVWVVTRRGALAGPHNRALLWRAGAAAGLLTATVQAARGPEPPSRDIEAFRSFAQVESPGSPAAHSGALPGPRDAGPEAHAPVRIVSEVEASAAVASACRDAIRASEGELRRLLARSTPGPAAPSALPPTEHLRGRIARACDVGRGAGWPWALLAMWGAGAGVAGLRLSARHRRFRDVLDPAWPASPRARRLLDRTRERASLPPGILLFEAPGLTTPVALTGGRIGVPPFAVVEMPDDELEAALAHELGHLAHGDPGWLCVLLWIEAMFWFQPLNRVARRGFQDATEFVADAWAVRHVEKPLGLARSLERIAARGPHAASRLPVPAMARPESPVVERVRRILSGTPVEGQRTRWLSAGLLLPALLLPPVTVPAPAEVRVVVAREVSVRFDASAESPSTAARSSPAGSGIHVVRIDARR